MTDDLELALILASLFRDTKAKPRGTLLWPGQRDRLAADKPLAAYFASVAEAGAEGWKEEMDRMRGRLKDTPPEERGETRGTSTPSGRCCLPGEGGERWWGCGRHLLVLAYFWRVCPTFFRFQHANSLVDYSFSPIFNKAMLTTGQYTGIHYSASIRLTTHQSS
ncbi:MAG TPA: hypothetical protein VM661_01940 [Candidatus Sulfotelmatobacter sp.]|jgi:hypothetical protein|nr:hypothetical protein [Candidatus Sulfotelmatobacter sp.]